MVKKGIQLPDIADAINALLDYLWEDESADFESRLEADREGHIFLEIQAIRSWLTEHEESLD
jgi:hypothetical protein